MRILICGDRNWKDREEIRRILKILLEEQPDFILIEGGARGADTIAKEEAKVLGISDDRILEFPAEWDKFGKSAGVIRNRQMLDEGKPDLVIGLHNDLSKSKGTKDMITIAENVGIPCWLYRSLKLEAE